MYRLARFRSIILFIGLISLLAIIAQLIFQSILLANKPYGHTLNSCTSTIIIIQWEIIRCFSRYDTDANSSIFWSWTVSWLKKKIPILDRGYFLVWIIRMLFGSYDWSFLISSSLLHRQSVLLSFDVYWYNQDVANEQMLKRRIQSIHLLHQQVHRLKENDEIFGHEFYQLFVGYVYLSNISFLVLRHLSIQAYLIRSIFFSS